MLSVKKLIYFALLSGVFVWCQAAAQTSAPVPVTSENLGWVTSPRNSGAQIARVLGAEKEPGLYVIRMKLAPGTKTNPHTHPDERLFEVLAGTLYFGFGETFDETKLVKIPTGAVFAVPAKMPHFAWAKDGETVYQESGIGPSSTDYLKQ